MATKNLHSIAGPAWELARRQHWIVTSGQLNELGFSRSAIRHRVSEGRLHQVHRGVYAVGRPHLERRGQWMAAVLACGPGTALSHQSALSLWGMRDERARQIHVSVTASRAPSPHGLVVHRRKHLARTTRYGIPVTTPASTLVDVAPLLTRDELEAAINEADIAGVTDPDRLRRGLQRHTNQPGVAVLRALLDRRTFRLTRSQLERMFIPIALRAGLPRPLTRQIVNGFEVDFWWPDLGLVVETDSLTYHRTAAKQTKDLVRDQSHLKTEVVPLRFSHAQIKFEPDYVERTLAAVAKRLAAT